MKNPLAAWLLIVALYQRVVAVPAPVCDQGTWTVHESVLIYYGAQYIIFL